VRVSVFLVRPSSASPFSELPAESFIVSERAAVAFFRRLSNAVSLFACSSRQLLILASSISRLFAAAPGHLYYSAAWLMPCKYFLCPQSIREPAQNPAPTYYIKMSPSCRLLLIIVWYYYYFLGERTMRPWQKWYIAPGRLFRQPPLTSLLPSIWARLLWSTRHFIFSLAFSSSAMCLCTENRETSSGRPSTKIGLSFIKVQYVLLFNNTIIVP